MRYTLDIMIWRFWRRGVVAAATVIVAMAGLPGPAAISPALAQLQSAQAHLQVPTSRPTRGLAPVLTAEQRDLYERALAALDAGRPAEAHLLATRANLPVGRKLIRWIDLQSGGGFDEIAEFIRANPDWPLQETLTRRAEEALADRNEDALVLGWFAERTPLTTEGATRLIDALMRAGDRVRAIQLARETWVDGTFGDRQGKQFLSRHAPYLGRDEHWARLDRLLWDGRREEARRMLPLVEPGRRALAEARMHLAAQAPGVEGALRTVPASLLDDPGLLYERLRWRRRNGQDDGAVEILRQPPRDLKRPELWWAERAIVARRLLAVGRAPEAYRIARDHRLANGPAFAEGEFLAGWIALRFLRDPNAAADHFTRLHAQARFPTTRARGAYWAGRAIETAGDKRQADEWYRNAAEYNVTYYGQLARSRVEPAQRPPWPEIAAPAPAERDAFERSDLVLAARILAELGERDRLRWFVLRLATVARAPAQHMLAAELALALQRPDLAVQAAKRSAQTAGVLLPVQGWPVIAVPEAGQPERALVLAAIRQESQFEAVALSRAGARGMMQLMPATARAMARDLGVGLVHADYRLVADPDYNIRLGRAYLASMIGEFGGSYVLALAAYNAGPGRVRQWLRDHGDPRQPDIDVVDWVEQIPFEETRNYVQRVIENLQVYRWRMGVLRAAGIEQDLIRPRNS